MIHELILTKPKAIQTVQLDEQIGFKLRLAQLAVFSDIIEALKGFDLRPVDLSALMLIESNPGINQRIVGEKLKIARPNIVGLIDSLSSRDLVERVVNSDDRRSNLLKLTPRGCELLIRAKAAQEEHRQRILEALEGVDIGTLARGLDQLAKLAKITK